MKSPTTLLLNVGLPVGAAPQEICDVSVFEDSTGAARAVYGRSGTVIESCSWNCDEWQGDWWYRDYCAEQYQVDWTISSIYGGPWVGTAVVTLEQGCEQWWGEGTADPSTPWPAWPTRVRLSLDTWIVPFAWSLVWYVYVPVSVLSCHATYPPDYAAGIARVSDLCCPLDTVGAGVYYVSPVFGPVPGYGSVSLTAL